jgi:hypothetical protein
MALLLLLLLLLLPLPVPDVLRKPSSSCSVLPPIKQFFKNRLFSFGSTGKPLLLLLLPPHSALPAAAGGVSAPSACKPTAAGGLPDSFNGDGGLDKPRATALLKPGEVIAWQPTSCSGSGISASASGSCDGCCGW